MPLGIAGYVFSGGIAKDHVDNPAKHEYLKGEYNPAMPSGIAGYAPACRQAGFLVGEPRTTRINPALI